MAERAGIYDRVSDDDQGHSRSVAQQAQENEEAASHEGWRVAARYADPGVSASRFARKTRDDWPRLLDDLRHNRLDVVILWESSRGDRKLTEWSQFLDLARETGTKIHVTTHDRTYDLQRARDWKTLAEEGVSNAYASEETSLRIRRDMADAAARGIPHGRLPYGYRRRYDPLTRRLIAQESDPAQAPVVVEIITRIADGHAISALIRDLTERGIPTPTGRDRWARSTISRIVLHGVCYIGKRRHNGGPLLDGNWPALIDEATYWRAVTVLQDPERKKAANGRGGILPGRARWLLSYVATCAMCGVGLGVTHRMRNGIQTPMYRCSSSQGGCAYAPVQWLDGLVADAIIRHLASPERYEPPGSGTEARAAQDEAAAEHERLAGFEADAIIGKISASSFARIAGGIEQRITDLESRARELSTPPALSGLLVARSGPHWDTAARRLDMLERWDSMPLAAQRRAVSAVCTVQLSPAGTDPVESPERIQITWLDA